MKKATPRYIMLRLENFKDKEIMKASREKTVTQLNSN